MIVYYLCYFMVLYCTYNAMITYCIYNEMIIYCIYNVMIIYFLYNTMSMGYRGDIALYLSRLVLYSCSCEHNMANHTCSLLFIFYFLYGPSRQGCHNVNTMH